MTPLKSAQTWWDCWSAGPGVGWSLCSFLNCTSGSSGHHICVISPTVRLEMKQWWRNFISVWFCCLESFSYPGDAPGLLLLCIPWTDLRAFPVLGMMGLNGCRLRKFYIFFFSFLQLCKHVWLNPCFLHNNPIYIYIYISMLYNLSQGQFKSHYFIFSGVKTV